MLVLNSDVKKIRLSGLFGPFVYLPWYWAMKYLYPGTWNPFSIRFIISLMMWAVAAYTYVQPTQLRKQIIAYEIVFFMITLHHFWMTYENPQLVVYRYTFFLVTVMGGAVMSSMRSFILLVGMALVCKAFMFTLVHADIQFEIFEFFLWISQFFIIGWLIRSIFHGRAEILQLSEQATQAAISVEVAKASIIEADKKLLEQDLEVAGSVQTLLMPQFNQMTSGQIEMCSFFQPASRAGGDWWWFSETTNGRSRLFVGDVTGHGVGSAMVTALLAGCYQTAVELIKDAPMEDLLEILNLRLEKSCRRLHWMTFSAIEFDPVTRKVEFWSMASPEIFITHKNDTQMVYGSTPSSPLGSGELSFTKTTSDFEPGDQLFIFTDGMCEFIDKSSKQFGIRRLKKLYVESLEIASIEQQVEFLATGAKGARLVPELDDDITFAVVRFKDVA